MLTRAGRDLSFSATMVTALLPPLTDESDASYGHDPLTKSSHRSRNSIAFSLESQLTITPERFAAQSQDGGGDGGAAAADDEDAEAAKPSVLAGLVGLFTGCGALVALLLFLPLPVRFGRIEGTTSAEAVSYSFYVVSMVAFVVAIFVWFGLRGVKGEEGKGWRLLLGLSERHHQSEVEGLRQRRTMPSIRDVRYHGLTCYPLTLVRF